MNLLLPETWKSLLCDEITKPYFRDLLLHTEQVYKSSTSYPPIDQVFNAFKYCPPEKLKVVLLGQDPYHGPAQAHGLAFSVNDGIKLPPSLRNIFKEMLSDLPDFIAPSSGNLEKWAMQGVLLLNAILTVEAGNPGSHKNFGWEKFTDAVIKTLSDKKENLVFMLWGNFALSKLPLIDQSKHLVLKAAHPSPLARGAFFGSKHFSQANAYLRAKGKEEIDWHLYYGNL